MFLGKSGQTEGLKGCGRDPSEKKKSVFSSVFFFFLIWEREREIEIFFLKKKLLLRKLIKKITIDSSMRLGVVPC